MDGDRFDRAIAAIDAANADDPNRITVAGEERPKELAHAELVTAWVERLRPDAGEALLLAARAHHLRRWAIPRDSYPEGRKGYLRWRRDLEDRHAVEAGEILRDAGYDAATVDRAGGGGRGAARRGVADLACALQRRRVADRPEGEPERGAGAGGSLLPPA